MDLPWLEHDRIADHASQIGILARPDNRIEMVKFCECDSYRIIGENLNYTKMEFLNREFSCIFGSGDVNSFCSNVFKRVIGGVGLVYVRNVDLTKEDIESIIKAVKN